MWKIIALLLFGVLASQAKSVTCPKASLKECLYQAPSADSCVNTTSWLMSKKSPVRDAAICVNQRKAMEAECNRICPPASCLQCYDLVGKAVSDCEKFYLAVQNSTIKCDAYKRKLLQHCSQPQICKVCQDSYCQNGGVCHKGSTPHVTSCKCPQGFGGLYCQTKFCDGQHKCQNGGTCVGPMRCNCPPDIKGAQCEYARLGTPKNPAPNAKAILEAGDSRGSGLYWIKPHGDDEAAVTYCDMDYQGGGWMLASYGYVSSTDYHANNRNIPNMNNPMGYLWNPDKRSSSHGLVNLLHGAVTMARAATHMMMAAGGNPSSGGINQYDYVYRIDLRQNRQCKITFRNHNRFHGAMGLNGVPKMHLTEYTVEGLKGDIGTYVRYGFCEALGATVGDAYPTGYGFLNSGVEAGSLLDKGPFFPSVHCGDGGGRYIFSNKVFQPDVHRGSDTYTYYGWLAASGRGKTGQTSIWFK